MNSSVGFVYAVLNPGTNQVKFGHSVEPERRLMVLNTGSSSKLELLGYWPGSKEDERSLHAKFLKYRIGGEWFIPSIEVCKFLFSQCNADIFHLRPRATSQMLERVDPQAKTQILRLELTELMTGNAFLAKYKIPLSKIVFNRTVSRVAAYHGIERKTTKIVTRVSSTGRITEAEVWVYPEFVWLAAYSTWAWRKRGKKISEIETEIRLATADNLESLQVQDLVEIIHRQSRENAALKTSIAKLESSLTGTQADLTRSTSELERIKGSMAEPVARFVYESLLSHLQDEKNVRKILKAHDSAKP